MTEKNLYPAYAQGYFAVSEAHQLYFERYGTAGTLPVLYLHGGPGSGFSDKDKGFFDPKRFDVLLFDQRGAGRSRPFASLAANTTDDLIDDINHLLAQTGLEQVLLFGGSWGSTLALTYAIRHPERVLGMILRGIFLGSQESIDFYLAGGVATQFPDAWARFIALVPDTWTGSPADYYLQQMASADEATAERYCYEWAYYELSMLTLAPPTEAEMAEMLASYSYRSMSPLEAHYLTQGCFLPEDYILQHAHTLSGVPTHIIHGRYDAICPPKHAYQLYQKIEGAKLEFVTAGHASQEPAVKAALQSALAQMADLLG